jgi:hypothetical protein
MDLEHTGVFRLTKLNQYEKSADPEGKTLFIGYLRAYCYLQ